MCTRQNVYAPAESTSSTPATPGCCRPNFGPEDYHLLAVPEVCPLRILSTAGLSPRRSRKDVKTPRHEEDVIQGKTLELPSGQGCIRAFPWKGVYTTLSSIYQNIA